MRCEQIRELISPYLDQMTDDKENQVLEAHFAECPVCRRELEQMKAACALLHNLETPAVPEGFAQDLRQRLAAEKVRKFTRRQGRISKRGGIAAGVAGVALGLGIYLSTYMPVGTVVAFLNHNHSNDANTPSMAVEDILDRYVHNMQNEGDSLAPGEETMIAVVDPAPEDAANKPSVGNEGSPKSSQESNGSTVVESPVGETPGETVDVPQPEYIEPKIQQSFDSQIWVEDIENGIQHVYQIAQANGCENPVINPSTSTLMDVVTDDSRVKIMSLTVSDDKAQSVLEELAVMGAAAPLQKPRDYSGEYSNINSSLTELQNQIKAFEAKEDLTADENAQLVKLKQKESELLGKKTTIDQNMDTVTITVYLLQEVEP